VARSAGALRAGKTCYDRFSRWEQDGTWARIEQQLQAGADAAGELDWNAQADSSIMRVHQHAAGARKGGSLRPSRRQRKASAVPGAA
jgi:transposase